MVNRMILNETSYFGKGAVENVATEISSRGFQKPIIITDKGLIDAGVVEKVTKHLDNAGIEYTTYDGIVPNPTIENVKDGVEAV